MTRTGICTWSCNFASDSCTQYMCQIQEHEDITGELDLLDVMHNYELIMSKWTLSTIPCMSVCVLSQELENLVYAHGRVTSSVIHAASTSTCAKYKIMSILRGNW